MGWGYLYVEVGGIKWLISGTKWEIQRTGFPALSYLEFVHMLIGEYKHSLDDKKRLSLPAKFRTELGKKLVVTRGLEKCLFVYSQKEWKSISERLSDLGMGQAQTRGFARFMLAGAVEVDVDSAGRILVPDFLKSFAGLTASVVLAGVASRVEIWNEKAWSDYKRRIEKEADTLAENLGEIGAI